MSYADNRAGEKLLFLFGDGVTPETFAAACSINTERSLQLTNELFTGTVPDCDDPSKPSKTVRRIKSKDVRFTGAGVADMASAKTLLQKWNAGAAFNGKAVQDVPANGWIMNGSWVIESLELTGTKGEDQQFNITLAQADELTISYT